MDIRKLMVIVAAACVAPIAAFGQAAGSGSGSDSGGEASGGGATGGGGGSAGDFNKPMTYTKRDFSDIDKDKNGIADKKELAGSRLDGVLIKRIDANGDGQVTQSEFESFQASTSGNKLPARK